MGQATGCSARQIGSIRIAEVLTLRRAIKSSKDMAAYIAVARGTMLTAIEAIVARFNAISRGLRTAPERHQPILEKTEDGLAHPHPWCIGFVAAMRLPHDAWQPLLTSGPPNSPLMLPILLYCADVAGAPLPDLVHAPLSTESLLRIAYQDIPRVVPVREYWMPQWAREPTALSNYLRGALAAVTTLRRLLRVS
jgi:Uncharacterised protein family (UPF0149)